MAAELTIISLYIKLLHKYLAKQALVAVFVTHCSVFLCRCIISVTIHSLATSCGSVLVHTAHVTSILFMFLKMYIWHIWFLFQGRKQYSFDSVLRTNNSSKGILYKISESLKTNKKFASFDINQFYEMKTLYFLTLYFLGNGTPCLCFNK